MKLGTVIATMLAGLSLATAGASAQSSTSVTTNSYSASSTAEDMRASCKKVWVRSGGTLYAKCNKADDTGSVSAVSTTLDMPKYANCRASGRSYTVQWGAGVTGITTTSPEIVLSSTGDTYVLEASCKDRDGNKWGPSELDIGDTSDGLKNDKGSLAKR